MKLLIISVFITIIIVLYFVYVRREGFFGKSGDIYVTFDGLQKSYPVQTQYPKTLEEISQIITDNPGQTIRASGNECVYNNLYDTDLMIRVDNLNKIIKLNVDAKEITVESGCTIEDICKYLEEHNLGLAVIPDNLEQTIGNACQNSEHGSNINTGTLADQVLAMTAVLSNGHIRQIELDDPEFPAFVSGLGILGVIYSLTLKCVDLYYIIPDKKVGKWSKIKDTELHDCSRITIDPQTMGAVVVTGKISLDEGIVYYRAIPRRIIPNTITKCEVAVNVDKLVPAVNDIAKLIASHKKISELKIKDITITFSGGDYNSWLSPASGMSVAWISVNAEIPNKDKVLNKFFQDYEDLMLYKYSGRPSWSTVRGITPYKMRLLYGASVDYVRRAQRQFDPTLRCTNRFIENIL